MPGSEGRGIWLAVAALIILAALLVYVIVSAKPFTLVVLFVEVGDLKKEDPVVWKGFNVGRVEEIQPLVDGKFGVTIRIKDDYVSKITHGSEFLLKRAALLGLVGKNAVEVVTPATAGSAFASGEKVQGRAPSTDSILEQGKTWSLEYWQQVKDLTARLVEQFQDSPYRKEAEGALEKLRGLVEKSGGQARDQVEEFGKAHQKELEAALRTLERIRDEMRSKGDASGANELDKQIQKLKK